MYPLVLLSVLAIALGACDSGDGSGVGGDGSSNAVGNGSGGTGAGGSAVGGGGQVVGSTGGAGDLPLPVYESYLLSVRPLLTEACNCHQTEPTLLAPFSLKLGEAYDNLVGVPSMQVPTMQMVQPGDLQASYLWHKVKDTHLGVGGEGKIMPPTIPLYEHELAIVEAWILDGAPR